MKVINARYDFNKTSPFDAETITEVVLYEEASDKKYHVTFCSWDVVNNMFITDKPLVDTYLQLSEEDKE